MRPALMLSLFLALGSGLAAGTLTYPPYQYGIRPSGAQDTDLSSAYSTWKTRYFRSLTCGQSMAWVSNGGSEAFSEGQAYGLLMAAYLDANSTDFARLWRFYEMKMDSRGLMNWRVPGDCGGNNGANAATDADLDAAIALIRAHRRWPAEGWGAKASTLLNNIYTHMVDGCQGLKNGDTWGGCSSGANNAYNPSYFRTGYMPSFNCFEGSSRWTAVRNRSYQVASHSYNNYALPPDWVRNDGTWGQATNSGGYGYDSCRSPWTFVQDYLWWGNSTGQNWGRKIGLVFGNKAPWGNPASAASDMGDDYSYSSGNKVRNNHENAFIGGAAVAFMGTSHTAHLNAFYTELNFNDNNSYYSDSLKVLYLMILTGAFQEPCYGPGPIPTATPTATPTPYAGTPTMTPMPAFGLVFEDFENGITGNYGYPAAVQSAQARSASAAHAGAYGYAITNATVAGGGVGFGSSYANGLGVFDATGAVSLRFWVNNLTAGPIQFQVDWFEAGATGAPVAGGDGEAWVSGNINVAAASGWTQVVIPISSMIEEIYNGNCNPSYLTPGPCGTTGNNTMDLGAVNRIQIKFTLGTAATIHFDDFEFVLGTQPSPTSTRTPFIGSYNQVFDDIESPLSLNQAVTPKMAGGYADTANGATATVGTSTAVLAPGGGANTTSGLLTYNTGTGTSYGAGGFLLSPYSNEQFFVDASGAVFLGLWINAPAGLAYRIAFQEAGTPTSPTAGAEGEAWQSNLLVASGGWEFVQLEVGSFSEDIYNPVCNPTSATPGPCGSTGDGAMDFQAIASVTLKLEGNQGSGNFYFDDVVFVTSFKTPTPTRSPTTAPTFTRTPTPSVSPSHTHTVTLTPSHSNTYTPTPVPSDTATPTATPTETLYAGSPTDTPAATDTHSPTRTATPSGTPSITHTITPTRTPQPGSPTYTVAVPSATFTATVTPSFTLPPTLTHTPLPGSPTYTVTATLSASPTLTLTATPTRTFDVNPTPICSGHLMGTSTTFSSTFSTAAENNVYASRYTRFTSTWVNRLSVDAYNGSNALAYVRLALYSDVAGAPGNLLAETGWGNISSNSRGYFSIPTTLLVPGSYWIAVQADRSVSWVAPSLGTFSYIGGSLWFAHTFGPFPSTFPASSSSPLAFSLAASFDCNTPTVTRTRTPGGPTNTPFVPTATFTRTATPSATPTPTSTPMIVDAGAMWSPSELTVTAGTTVTWYWSGTHSVTSDSGLFDSGTPVAGGSFAYTFGMPGTYPYHCAIHGGVGGVGMSGKIYVVGVPTVTPTPGTPGGDGSQVIIDAKPYPNPVLKSGGIKVHLAVPVEKLSFKLYTASMVLVAGFEVGPQLSGWVTAALPAGFLGQTAGTYFYVVTATRNKAEAAPKSGTVTLLR